MIELINNIRAKPARRLYKKEFVAKSARFTSKSRRVQLRTHRMLNHLSSKVIKRTTSLNDRTKRLIKVEQFFYLTNLNSKNKLLEEKLRLIRKVDSLVDALENEKIRIIECEKLGNKIFTSFRPTQSLVHKNIQLERDLHVSWNKINHNLSLLELLSNELSGKAPSLKSIQRNRKIGRDKI